MDLYNLIISAKLSKGEGGDVSVDPLSVTENGTYTASSGHAYSPVTVSVPTGVFPSGTSQITSNGMYDVTNFASASVNVPGIVPSGTSSITANGIYDITNFASVDVNVSGGGGGDHDAEDAIIQRTISGTYVNSRITGIGSNVFAYCWKLANVDLPNINTVGSNAFNGCTSMLTASIPKVTRVYHYAFNNCNSLASIDLPKCSYIYSNAFANCIKLSKVNIGVDASSCHIESSAFYNCNSLTNFTILTPDVAVLKKSVFVSTPMSNSTYTGSFGSIYVPASLVNSYKAASNWSYYADRITAYEG